MLFWPHTFVNLRLFSPGSFRTIVCLLMSSASDFFQDWWADVTHGAKYGGSFSEMMGPSISN